VHTWCQNWLSIYLYFLLVEVQQASRRGTRAGLFTLFRYIVLYG